MTSHEYARKLQELSEFLLTKPDFETGTKVYMFLSYYEREGVVQAVRALGAGRKEFENDQFYFHPEVPEGIFLRVECPRDKICKLVEPAKYDCEPLLTPEEAAAL